MRAKLCVVVFGILATAATSCSKDPETAKREYLAQGDRLFAAKKYTEAILEYRKAVQADGRFGDARLKLAQAYLATSDARNALAESVRAADLMPDNADAQVYAGELLLASGQFPEAKSRATAAIAKDARNARALVLLGNSLAALKDLDGAIKQVEEAIDANPQQTLTYANLGALQVAAGDRDAAEFTFKRAVELAPTSVLARVSLANFQWATGARVEAEQQLKTALEIEPRSILANRALATLLMAQSKHAEAEPYLKAYSDLSGTVDSRLLLADSYVRSKKLAEATALLSTLAKEDAGYVGSTLRVAVLDFDGKRRAEAYRRLDEILAKKPGTTSALQMKARFLLADGKNRDALTVADALVRADAKSVTAHYLRGSALEALGSNVEAIEAFKAVLQGAPSAFPAQIRLASLYLTQNNAAEAVNLSRQAVTAQPRAGSAHLVYGQSLLKAGDLSGAERQLLGLAKETPTWADAHAWLGMVYEAKRDLVRARQSYEKALGLQPDATVALAGLVSVDLAQGKPAAALARIESRMAASPDDPRLVMMAAMAYMATRDAPKAEAAYRRVIQLAPNDPDAYGRLGAIYLAQGRLEEAKKTFQDLANHQPNAVGAETMLGTILMRQNKGEEARKHFERALAIDPRAAVAANNLAWDYANNGGNLDLALQLAQTAKSQMPDSAEVNDTLGWIYYQKGLAGLAVTSLKAAAQKSPASPGIQYRLGLAYLKDGKKTEAKSTLEQVLKTNPQFPDAAEVRRVLASIES